MAGTRTSSQRFYGSTSPAGTGGGSGGIDGGGGYDRYMGTIGLAADAPAGAIFPHNTEFPAANKYDWLQVVSNARLNGKDIFRGQELVCSENNTAKGVSSKWDLRQRTRAGNLVLINSFTRTNRFNNNVIVQPNRVTPLALAVPSSVVGKTVYTDTYRTEITEWLNSYEEGENTIILDMSGTIFFSPNPEGFREIRLYLQEFFIEHDPGETGPSGLLVGGAVNGRAEGDADFLLAGSVNNASARGTTSVSFIKNKFERDLYSDFQVILYLYANHSAPVPLEIQYSSIAVSMWRLQP